jgi:hypothetical protein
MMMKVSTDLETNIQADATVTMAVAEERAMEISLMKRTLQETMKKEKTKMEILAVIVEQ